METWSVHHLFQQAAAKLDGGRARQLQQYAVRLISDGLPVVFSLAHLARITGTSYGFLHDTVNRKREGTNYRLFAISKRTGGRRFIHAVAGKLLGVQQFINTAILQQIRPHAASFAFDSWGGIQQCAAQHCGARWLFQFDLADFFFSISEARVYGVFQKMGYRKLLAFEMARLCTTTHLPESVKRRRIEGKPLRSLSWAAYEAEAPPYALRDMMGVLPQGAPTSPMLSNLVARDLDEAMQAFAYEHCLVYTRYADDLTLSCVRLPTDKSVAAIRRTVIDVIRKNGFAENRGKIRIAGPGARKVVLGLLVDGDHPRLSRQMRARIDRLLYASTKFGLEGTAEHEGFASAYGFYNHLQGLVAFAKDVDPTRWDEFHSRFKRISPPV